MRGEHVFQAASENMTDYLWVKLGKRVNELLAQGDVDGIALYSRPPRALGGYGM